MRVKPTVLSVGNASCTVHLYYIEKYANNQLKFVLIYGQKMPGTLQCLLIVNIKAALSGNREARPSVRLFISADLSGNLQHRKPYPLSVLL